MSSKSPVTLAETFWQSGVSRSQSGGRVPDSIQTHLKLMTVNSQTMEMCNLTLGAQQSLPRHTQKGRWLHSSRTGILPAGCGRKKGKSRDFGKSDGLDGSWKLSRTGRKRRQEGRCQSARRARTVWAAGTWLQGVGFQGRAVDTGSTAIGSQGEGVETLCARSLVLC